MGVGRERECTPHTGVNLMDGLDRERCGRARRDAYLRDLATLFGRLGEGTVAGAETGRDPGKAACAALRAAGRFLPQGLGRERPSPARPELTDGFPKSPVGPIGRFVRRITPRENRAGRSFRNVESQKRRGRIPGFAQNDPGLVAHRVTPPARRPGRKPRATGIPGRRPQRRIEWPRTSCRPRSRI